MDTIDVGGGTAAQPRAWIMSAFKISNTDRNHDKTHAQWSECELAQRVYGDTVTDTCAIP